MAQQQRINISLPADVLALLDAHTSNRSAYIAKALRKTLVADALTTIAAHNGGVLPYAGELDGIEDEAA